MVKKILLAAGAVFLCAAAPNKYGSFPAPLFQGNTVLPQGPAQQQVAAGEFTPAPLPASDAPAPLQREAGPAQAKFTPGLFNPNQRTRGDGYVPGSTVEGNQQRRFHPTPGINMSVPLQ